jgi:hypothetical protein
MVAGMSAGKPPPKPRRLVSVKPHIGVTVAFSHRGVEVAGTIIGQAPGVSTWWVMPAGEQRAVEVRSSEMRKAKSTFGAPPAWDASRMPKRPPIEPRGEPLSDAEPSPYDVSMFSEIPDTDQEPAP